MCIISILPLYEVFLCNMQPSIAQLHYSNAPVSCTRSNSDDDGETPTTIVEWTIGSHNTTEAVIQSHLIQTWFPLVTPSPQKIFWADSLRYANHHTQYSTHHRFGYPSPPNKHDTLLCEASSSDIDGDTSILSFAWSNLTKRNVYTSTNTTTDSALWSHRTTDTLLEASEIQTVRF